MSRVRVCIVTGFGINADEELALAFEKAGAMSVSVHAQDLIDEPRRLRAFQILAFPGGFSFGDHLGSGKVFAALFRRAAGPDLEQFIFRGGLVIGVCNGFQALVKMGYLPDLSGSHAQEVSLIHNDSGKFEDRWVRVGFERSCPCVWTRGLADMDLPVRHGEGKFVAGSHQILSELTMRCLVAARYLARAGAGRGNGAGRGASVEYPDNPNGSEGAIAGICDTTGRVFGLMPHPEAFLFPENHPEWSRERVGEGAGLAIFRNGVAAAKHTARHSAAHTG